MNSAQHAAPRGAEQQAEIDRQCRALTLYQFERCPFCRRVLQEIDRLGLDIAMRNTLEEPGAREELRRGGGRTMVPCLRIEHDDGRIEWLYESMDIIARLRQRFEPQAH